MARAFLEKKGCEEARLEAELLVAHALGKDRLGLFMDLERPVEGREIDLARDLLMRRGRREPVAYITGEREFYGRAFRVSREVLIPRPETELLVDRAREWAREALKADRGTPDSDAGAGADAGSDGGESAGLSILDWGTGSGCLAATLALEIEGARVVAVDAFEATLDVARGNAERLGAGVELRLANDFGTLNQSFDLLVTNPPYVDPKDSTGLAPEVRDYEPHAALFAPEGDPDYWVRAVLEHLPRLVRSGGVALIELGADQAPRVLELAKSAGVRAQTLPDLAGIERVLELVR